MDTEKTAMEEMLKNHHKPPKPFKYALVTLGGHLASRILLTFVTTGSNAESLNVAWEIIVTLISYIGPLYFVRLYLQNADTEAQYREGVHWAKSFFWLAFPGELIRFLISIPGVTGRFFSYTGWQLMTLLYMVPQMGNVQSEEGLLALVASTAVLLPLFNLLALVLYLAPILWWYRRHWQEGQKEWEHLKQTYAEHEREAEARDEMPDVAPKVIPSHKRKDFETFNQFHGERKKK